MGKWIKPVSRRERGPAVVLTTQSAGLSAVVSGPGLVLPATGIGTVLVAVVELVEAR